MTGQRATCAVCDHDAGAPTAPLRRPAYRDGKYLCAAHAAAPERHIPGATEQADAEQREAHLRRHPPQDRAAVAHTAPPQSSAPPGAIPQGPAVTRLPRTPRSTRLRQGENPRRVAPEQGTERALSPTQGTRAALPRHVPSPSHAAPPAPPAPPASREPGAGSRPVGRAEPQATSAEPGELVDAPPLESQEPGAGNPEPGGRRGRRARRRAAAQEREAGSQEPGEFVDAPPQVPPPADDGPVVG